MPPSRGTGTAAPLGQILAAGLDVVEMRDDHEAVGQRVPGVA